jgi:beta-glucanase (GH16 family)
MNDLLLIPLLLIAGCNHHPAEIDGQKDSRFVPEGYALIWNDEFDSDTNRLPDSALWYFETGDHGWGNNELQNYVAGVDGSDTCALVSGGVLKIIAKKKGGKVISIRMNSEKSWTYGYFEARLKLPQGKGTWSAFWMLPQNIRSWPAGGEIDIMEEVGYQPNRVSSSIHCQAYNHAAGTGKTGAQYVETAETDFHVYAVEWTDDCIRGFVDGNMHLEFRNDGKGNKDTWPFDVPFYLKLNLAWGGNWGGYEGVDESKLPAVYEIDYVRVYQRR